MTSVGKYVIRWVSPFIMVLGAYVVIFGHISPGGGFAGGALLAVGQILPHFAGEKSSVFRAFKKNIFYISLCLIIYGLIKGLAFLEGAWGIHLVHWPLGSPGTILSAGAILPLNLLVGFVVMLVFVSMYALFTDSYEREETL